MAEWIAALWPPLVMYSIRTTPAFFDAALIPAVLLLVLRVFRRAGLSGRRALGSTLRITIGVRLVLAPWAARNTLLLHRPALVSTNFGLNLYRSNVAEASPSCNIFVVDDNVRRHHIPDALALMIIFAVQGAWWVAEGIRARAATASGTRAALRRRESPTRTGEPPAPATWR